jgi:uncharacterized RDD family membrane protein YckC
MDEQKAAPVITTAHPVGAVMHKRFLNYLVDYYCMVILLTTIYIIVGLITQKPLPDDSDTSHINLVYAILFFFAYYTFFEAIWGKTPGKFVSRTKVVTKDGKKPNFSTILKRGLCRLVPFDMLSFLRERNPEGWHDKWVGTIVVDEKNTQPTKSGPGKILGLMIVDYVVSAIVFFVVFGLLIALMAITIPKPRLQKILPPDNITPSPALEKPTINNN